MGHTPDFTQIVSKCNGRIIIIDTGITPAYGGIISSLKIEYVLRPLEALAPLSSQASSRARWKEVETVTALYPDSQKQLVKQERIIEGDY